MLLGLAQVRAVKLRRDKISVALEQKVLVYDFADLKLLHNMETLSNPNGLLALSAAADNTVLACPGLHVGQVGICRFLDCSHMFPIYIRVGGSLSASNR